MEYVFFSEKFEFYMELHFNSDPHTEREHVDNLI